jgi:excisionase family DNA binding protein
MSSEPRDLPELLTPSEVAARLRVSRTWLYEAARTGRIPSIRLCGGEGPLRFVPEDIDDWIAEARARWTPGRRQPSASSPAIAGQVVARRRRGV